MSGTLFGLGLSQQHDEDGRPMSGCLLYIYQANTSTPAVAYREPGLTAGQELPWPIVADSGGRIPAFWLADGAYRARLTDENGVVQFDEGNVLAVGSGTGPITVDPTPPEALNTTGDVQWRPAATTKTGWVRLNGRTIGSGSSGASERANGDCQALFTYLWQTFSDAVCSVVPGRGANAAADWGANKQITLFDMRGKSPFGLADMGNSDSGNLAGVPFAAGSATVGGSSGGENRHQLTQAELAAHTHANTLSDPGHKHTVHNQTSFSGYQGGGGLGAAAAGDADTTTNPSGVTISNVSVGSDQPHNNVPLFVLGTWYMRL